MEADDASDRFWGTYRDIWIRLCLASSRSLRHPSAGLDAFPTSGASLTNDLQRQPDQYFFTTGDGSARRSRRARIVNRAVFDLVVHAALPVAIDLTCS
jgi:hypothetical protein